MHLHPLLASKNVSSLFFQCTHLRVRIFRNVAPHCWCLFCRTIHSKRAHWLDHQQLNSQSTHDCVPEKKVRWLFELFVWQHLSHIHNANIPTCSKSHNVVGRSWMHLTLYAGEKGRRVMSGVCVSENKKGQGVRGHIMQVVMVMMMLEQRTTVILYP